MAFPFAGKKEMDIPGAPPAGTGPATAQSPESLEGIADRLGALGRELSLANQQMLSYLLHRDAQADGGSLQILADKVASLEQLLAARAPAEGTAAADAPATAGGSSGQVDAEALRAAFEPLSEKLAAIQARLEAPSAAPGESPAAPTAVAPDAGALAELRDLLGEQRESFASAFRQLRQVVDDGLQEVLGYVRPPEPDATASGPASNTDWQRAILGASLAANPDLNFQRQQLLDGVLEGNAGAGALAGLLLVFQSIPTEKMAPLLKDIGESYYRWQPKTRPGNTKFEEALAAWVERACDDAGIGNRIELVHPGERFDTTRHNATSRGVEITEVMGWIVLRDNGKVYTKATVAVR